MLRLHSILSDLAILLESRTRLGNSRYFLIAGYIHAPGALQRPSTATVLHAKPLQGIQAGALNEMGYIFNSFKGYNRFDTGCPEFIIDAGFHEEKGAAFASRASGFPLERTVKTLVVDLGKKQWALVLMPGDKQFSMKRLAKIQRVKRAAMADTRTAERITGYLVGGISPFGTRQKLPVVMEESILKFESILINAGQRGTMLKIAPDDIRTALAATVAVVAQS